jgi:hypothetical protein
MSTLADPLVQTLRDLATHAVGDHADRFKRAADLLEANSTDANVQNQMITATVERYVIDVSPEPDVDGTWSAHVSSGPDGEAVAAATRGLVIRAAFLKMWSQIVAAGGQHHEP